MTDPRNDQDDELEVSGCLVGLLVVSLVAFVVLMTMYGPAIK